MCGISAIIAPKGFDKLELYNITEVISHRGPDDEGYFASDFDKNNICFDQQTIKINDKLSSNKYMIGLGHRRLSIIDLSKNGHQPMQDQSKRYTIVYNGEIYNFIELREQLINAGIAFKTETDTEVILECYKKYGQDCLNLFNGMWSFLIYDSQKNKLFGARDRFGIKPMYYWINPDNAIYFASEIKQFTKAKGWNAKLNHRLAYDYLMYSLTDHNAETMFAGVYQILPGYSFEINIDGGYDIKNIEKYFYKWYKPIIKSFSGSFEEAKTTFLTLFKSAVEQHTRADVEVGSALSGGLDSSAIVSYLNEYLKSLKKSSLQKTFSSCTTDGEYDERHWMDVVTNHTNVDAYYSYADGNLVFSRTEQLVWAMDEPYQSQSALLGNRVFELAKENNVSVLLNGQGADEYLSGYSEFNNLRLFNDLMKGNIRSVIKEIKSPLKILDFAIKNFIIRNNLKMLIFSNKKKYGRCINFSILKKNLVHPYILHKYKRASVKEISNYQLTIDPLQKYLRWEDRNSMMYSIEARVPFLDHRLVEFCRGLPVDYLDGFEEPKRILRHSLKDILPKKIFHRKDKKGFITPEQKWFTKEFSSNYIQLFEDNIAFSKGIIDEKKTKKYLMEMQAGKISYDIAHWRLILFCIWMKVFKVEI